MSKPSYVYVTYIETSPEALWQALTDGDFTERYWFGHRIASDWKEGAPYRFTNNGNPTVEGEVIAFDPTRRLAYSWHNRKAEAAGEGISRVTFDLEPRGKVVKLTVTHDEPRRGRQDPARHLRRLADGAVEPEEPARDRPHHRDRAAGLFKEGRRVMPRPGFIYALAIPPAALGIEGFA